MDGLELRAELRVATTDLGWLLGVMKKVYESIWRSGNGVERCWILFQAEE